jgi:signal transduction histidine kinase/ActR/RegA family two-component response regulator
MKFSTPSDFPSCANSVLPEARRTGTRGMLGGYPASIKKLGADDVAASSTTSVSSQALVQAHLIEVLYSRARPITYANRAVALMVACFFLRTAALEWLFVWLALLALLTVAQLMLIRRYEKVQPSAEAAPKWGRYYALTLGISALIWATGTLAVFVFLPPDPLASLFIGMIFVGYSTGSIPVLSFYVPALLCSIVPVLTALILGFLMRADEFHLLLAGVATFFLCLNMVYARYAHRTFTDSISLRFENIHLIDELKRKKAEAENANVAKSKFLAAASHDLRQPLHALRMFGELMQSMADVDPKRRMVTEGVTSSTQALEGLLNALLDLSQLDARVVKPTLTHVPLAPLFDRLCIEFRLQARAKGLLFRIVPCRLAVFSDAAMLERMLRNLLTNALRYTDSGGIVMGARRAGEQLRIEIYDTGCGIPLDQVERIFDEFYQVGNAERNREKGLGLGLAIVQRLARILGCSITVDSTVGRGSRFGMVLPRGDSALVAQAPVPCADGDLADVEVLVIDDDAAVRSATTALLRHWGCRAVVAQDGEEALRQLKRRNIEPDVILTDSRLREHRTGMQAVERIRRVYRKPIPAIIMTGDTQTERLREAIASGCALLHKPVAPMKLRALMTSMLEVEAVNLARPVSPSGAPRKRPRYGYSPVGP